MTKRRLCLLPLLAAALAAAPARAGEQAFEAQAGYFGMASSNSASAVFDSTGAPTFGGAVRLTFWRGAFASIGGRTFSKDGERVFVLAPNDPVQKLGFPLSMRTTPLFVTAGYRLRRGSLVVPYVSAGVAITRYSESSEVAGQSFDEMFTKTGFLGTLGVEVGRGIFRVGGEVGYTTVPNAIGLGGVSKVYGEDDIGGWHAIGKVIVSFNGTTPPPPAKKPATAPPPKTPAPGPPVATPVPKP
jgi:hypothetical protein